MAHVSKSVFLVTQKRVFVSSETCLKKTCFWRCMRGGCWLTASRCRQPDLSKHSRPDSLWLPSRTLNKYIQTDPAEPNRPICFMFPSRNCNLAFGALWGALGCRLLDRGWGFECRPLGGRKSIHKMTPWSQTTRNGKCASRLLHVPFT